MVADNHGTRGVSAPSCPADQQLSAKGPWLVCRSRRLPRHLPAIVTSIGLGVAAVFLAVDLNTHAAPAVSLTADVPAISQSAALPDPASPAHQIATAAQPALEAPEAAPVPAETPTNEPTDQLALTRVPDAASEAVASVPVAETASPLLAVPPTGAATSAVRDDLSEQTLRAKLSDRTGVRPTEVPATPTPKPIRQITKYTVVDGDTLIGIGDRFGITGATIVQANGLNDANSLSVGKELVILPVSGQLLTVSEGNTVVDIATKYEVIPEDIVAVNKLADANSLHIGQQLIIPSGPVASEAAPADPAAATPAPAKPNGATGPEIVPKPTAPYKYQVAEGDTISTIADQHGISSNSIIWSNPSLADPQKLLVGQALTMPPVTGVVYSVAADDTLSRVAANYNASAADIARTNNLTDPYALLVGQVLVVPGGTPPSAQEPAAVAEVAEVGPTSAPAPTATPKPKLVVTQPQPAAPVAAAAAPKPKPAPAAPVAVAAAPKPAPAAPAVASGGGTAGAASIALRYVGYAYTWGGASPGSGFDCSGLTSYAYRSAGRPIPRDLWGQMNSGPRVSRGNLQVGDLVFFANTYTAGLSHVGIYVGGGRFVQAASEHTGVIVSSLGDAYWGAHYYGASRP